VLRYELEQTVLSYELSPKYSREDNNVTFSGRLVKIRAVQLEKRHHQQHWYSKSENKRQALLTSPDVKNWLWQIRQNFSTHF
jgi:hypothetical protein